MALPAIRQDAQAKGPLFIAVLAAITLIGPLVLHMFFPALPAVKLAFQANEAQVGLTSSVPLFTMALFTLAYGSLSDRYGRRPVLLAGLLLFVFGSELSALAESIWTLIAGRFLQAAGGACGMALARAIARDVYGSDRLVKVLAYLLMAYAMGPMVAPAIGGFLADEFGWRSVLVFASGIGIAITGLAYFVISETHHRRHDQASPPSLLTGYGRLFKDIDFTSYVLQSGFCSGAFFSMAPAAAFLMTDYLGRPATEFGIYFLFFPVGYWIGNLISSRLSGRVAIDIMVFAGSSVLVLTAVALAALMVFGLVSPLTIFIPGFLITFAQGMALPNAQAGALSVDRDLAGTAAGIGTVMQFFWAAVFTQLYSTLDDGTPIPMVITVSISAALSFTAGVIPFLRARS
jgi:DHA1 family bicyclomycin/chloramphenicol resistance-like MFS transporter